MIELLRPLAAWSRVVASVVLATVLTGCASVYLDGATKEVPAAQFTKPAKPVPVQVFFEFQTKGVANAQATALLKPAVLDQVKSSGLFDAVVEQASPGAAQLTITLNNVPLTDDAFTKGFITGFTFGLAGSQVSDGYVCTARYVPPNGPGPVSKSARHAIHVTLGATSAPGNATKMNNIDEAVRAMQRQVLSQVLNDLSKDSAFGR